MKASTFSSSLRRVPHGESALGLSLIHIDVYKRQALGIAIYGMFLAIILPPAKREKPVRLVVLLAVALSLCLRYVPLFSGISSGFAVILCAVIASAVGALLHPVKEAHAP